jgi:anaerobic selenocysteine-containing dehydrogenase
LTRIEPEGRLQLNPSDADRLGVEDGDMVRLRTMDGAAFSEPGEPGKFGEALVPVVRRAKVPPGFCRFPGHFPETGVKELVDWSIDSVTQVPYFRSGRVVIEKVAGAAAAVSTDAAKREGHS